jgi:Tfp pilus assembly protein PilZ
MRNLLAGNQGDRRSTNRLSLKIPLRYRIGLTAESEHLSSSEDISERGVFFETDQQASVGSVVELLVEMPKQINGSSVCPWICRGQVVRVDPISRANSRCGVGVKFDCYEVLPPQSKITENWQLPT